MAIALSTTKAITEVRLNQTSPFYLLLDTGAESTFISPQVATRLKLPTQTLQAIAVRILYF